MTATNFNEIIEKAKNELSNKKKSLRFKFKNISPEQFAELFLIRANLVLKKRKPMVDFVIDNDNKEIINQLYYYMIKSEKFESINLETGKVSKGDHEKGIILLGNLGSGKTIIMEAFIAVWKDLSQITVKNITAKKYADSLSNPEIYRDKKHGFIPDFTIAPLFIDDIGKESKSVKIYGTEICPMADLLAERYDNGSLTFATGNYKFDTLSNHYGETITDRMKEMFNILTISGESRRK